MAPLLYIQEKITVPRTGLRVSLYVTVMIAMFTNCLRPICHQYARTYYQKQPCQARNAILVECSKYRRSRGYLYWLYNSRISAFYCLFIVYWSATSGQYVGACFLLYQYKPPIRRYALSNDLRTEVFAVARVVSAIVGS